MKPSLAARQNMILGQLYTSDIADKRILQAMSDIPREPFLPESLSGSAYLDDNLEVSPGRYLLAPLILAKLLDLAEITPDARVLNIGCLTGYSAAILSRLASHVVAIDSDAAAIAQARDNMTRLGFTNVNVQPVKAMNDGYAMSAPYDVIVINGAISFISETLGSQLAVGGRLVTIRNIMTRPDEKAGLGKGLLVSRIEQKLQYREHFDASCPLLPGFEQPAGFAF